MVAYEDYLQLSRSPDSGARGQAAHFAASAFLSHDGPADEQAALYAAVMGFLDDPSVKVRAALAYGLLHSPDAPRPVMLALLHDAPVIGRAVAQYSPVLLDADLMALAAEADVLMARAIAARAQLGPALARVLYARDVESVTHALLERGDVNPGEAVFRGLTEKAETDAMLRGALLARSDLPGQVRLMLIDQVREALLGARLVKGAVAPRRLGRIMREARDTAITAIGEREVLGGCGAFVADLVEAGGVSTRIMLHALICGHVQFFAACLAHLSGLPQEKTSSILERGGSSALRALLSRCGIGAAARGLLARLVLHAREADLADDLSARYFVVTVLIEELIIEHDGQIPEALADAFAYLNEQNIVLARKAARGVMASFAAEAAPGQLMPVPVNDSRDIAA